MPTAVHFLRWADVNPAERSFDPAPARALMEAIVSRDQRVEREALEDSLDRALIAQYGAWAAGWRWAASEPGGGGPVRSWCCAAHSLVHQDDADAMASVDRAVAALSEWRSFLSELSTSFAALRAATSGMDVEAAAERAAGQLLPLVLERTGAEDAWYSTFAVVLSWYLESTGLATEEFSEALDSVVSGHFGSWIAPDAEAARGTCVALGRAVATAVGAGLVAQDALAAWQAVRGSAFRSASDSGSHEPVRLDGHHRYITGPEHQRDPDRARRMLAAVDAARASARRDEPLTLERLSQWQSLVLAGEVNFRTRDAYAKGGRERYPLDGQTQARFVAALQDANDTRTPLGARAARAYLDVCFFHPFDDGNARAARLVLDHVLTRAGFALHTVEPLFVVSRAAGDERGAWSFAYLVDYLMGRPG
jgi:hypothetical protein